VKQVLIIDESPLFREFLRVKLTGNGATATAAVNSMDGITKMRSIIPDMIIMDYHLARQGAMEVLQQKKANPNTAGIPVIILAQKIDQKKIIELVPYNVKKVFNKPVKIDALLSTLAQMLGITFMIDESPGIVELHVNDNIIFIEIAQGLNRDKIELLGFKIIELIELYQIKIPKLIVMMSGISLSFADGSNLSKLLGVIVRSSKAKNKYIRILTRDNFTRSFIEGQKDYDGIEVVSNLQYAVDDLLADLDSSMEYAEKKAEIIGAKLLSADNTEGESMQLRFESEDKLTVEEMRSVLTDLHIAVVDDDVVIQGIVKNAFTKAGARVSAFSNGAEFTSVLDTIHFDLIFLDLIMPRMDGFAVMRELKDRGFTGPVIVLSAVTQRDTVIRAFQMGVKSYLTKPLKPDDIFKKSMEILKVNF
jgi:DNA-binding response OmpR family regulator